MSEAADPRVRASRRHAGSSARSSGCSRRSPRRRRYPGAKYGSFGAGCHYTDGTFVPDEAQSGCPATAPQSGAKFSFWHPLLITMHVWLWYPNPSGLFASTNPFVSFFDQG